MLFLKAAVFQIFCQKYHSFKAHFVKKFFLSKYFCQHLLNEHFIPAILQPDGCAPAVPSGPWHLTFAPQGLENLRSFHRSHMLGTLDYKGSRHWAPSIFLRAQPWGLSLPPCSQSGTCKYTGCAVHSVTPLF